MDFRSLLSRYKQPITVIEKGDGYYCDETGQWVEGEEEEIETKAVVMPMSADDLRHDEGGAYDADDRKLYIHRNLKRNQKVKVSGNEYTVMEKHDYSYHANGLWFYVLKRSDKDD